MQSNHRFYTVLIIVSAGILSGCLSSVFHSPSTTLSRAVREEFEGEPDNCTKCHFLWTRRFDYYHGWDRYAYTFDGGSVSGFYDPWCRPSLNNLDRKYYASNWWDTPELFAWPKDIDKKAWSLSILSRGNGLTSIPESLEDIKGPVIVVAKENGDSKSIQAAIDRAEPGTTVFVRSDTYHEVLTLKDGVNLIGENAETTIVNPRNKGHALRAANNALITGFTFTGTGIDYERNIFHAAIYAAGTDSTCIIARNIFRENGLFGVWIDGTVDIEKNRAFDKSYGNNEAELHDRPYLDYPNPVITGNTFYRVGQRGVFCVHARGEVFNNLFLGNVKAMGLENHSRPFVHHNIFYFNNVPLAINRSEPVLCNNIMYSNQWGQRLLRGAQPAIFNNITWESPHFRDFDEAGSPVYYTPNPGTGELSFDPGLIDPFESDFRFSASSPLNKQGDGFYTIGLIRDGSVPLPPSVSCKRSWGREVLAMSPDIADLIEKVDIENAKIKDLQAAYTITYENYLAIRPDKHGEPGKMSIVSADQPAVKVTYAVAEWHMDGSKRFKKYRERCTVDGKTTDDSGTIVFNGSYIEALSGRFTGLYASTPDPKFVGERPFREAPGGFYRDYDQFVKGAIGTTGTFYHGLMRIMGGKIGDKMAAVDGHDCIVVRYPHIGKDQYCLFYLDPAIGYRPRKMEQFNYEVLSRRIDSYRYMEFSGGIHLPVSVIVTDFAVSKAGRGKIVSSLELRVDENSIKVNEGLKRISAKQP